MGQNRTPPEARYRLEYFRFSLIAKPTAAPRRVEQQKSNRYVCDLDDCADELLVFRYPQSISLVLRINAFCK